MEISEETETALNETVNEMSYNAKHRCKQIVEKVDRIVENIAEKDDVEVQWAQSYFKDAPPEVPLLSHPSSHALLEDIMVVGTIGQYYDDLSYEPTISQAFDAGFATAIKLLQKKLIELPEG